MCQPANVGRQRRQGIAPSQHMPDVAFAVLLPACLQGGYKYHQYQVVGRHVPTDKEPEPNIYRMKLWATDPVRAKSKFW
jgi:hypothetical protein